MSDVTRILSQIEQGDPQAAELLLPLVYEELRKLATSRLAQEKPGQTLQATALVHEAYLRLVRPGVGNQEPGASQNISQPSPDSRSLTPAFDSRGHFFAAAAEAMRRILVDQARRKATPKHGGGLARFDIDALDVAVHTTPDQLLVIDEALTKLGRDDATAARIVNLRYFAGLTVEQAAAALGISTATAYRHWNYARSWLHSELLGSEPSGSSHG